MRQIDGGLIDKLLCVVKDAGGAVLQIYQSGLPSSVEHKADHSPLTQADKAAHQVLVQGLSGLLPDCPVVSEEDENSHKYLKKTGRFWLIDPLDGTKEFIARNGEFTVNVALIEDGLSVLGVVYAPAVGQLYWGGLGFGAYKEQGGCIEPIQTSKPKQNSIKVLASKSHLNAETQVFVDSLGYVQLIQAGSSLKFCTLAEGEADIYPRLAPTCQWDTAAAQAVLEGAGGVVLQLDGTGLTYGHKEVPNPSFVAAADSVWLKERLGYVST